MKQGWEPGSWEGPLSQVLLSPAVWSALSSRRQLWPGVRPFTGALGLALWESPFPQAHLCLDVRPALTSALHLLKCPLWGLAPVWPQEGLLTDLSSPEKQKKQRRTSSLRASKEGA